MATNYKSIPAVGQIDPTACWAASLNWWLMAMDNQTKGQNEIFSILVGDGKKQVCSGDGQFYTDVLQEKLAANYPVFKMFTDNISPGELADWLEPGVPIVVGFTTPTGTGHMNVIFDYDKKAGTVQAMEPWFPNLRINRDGNNAMFLDAGAKFTGTITSRNLSYYQPLKSGRLLVGSRVLVGKINMTNRSKGSGTVSAGFW